ncbi:MAG: hypothetical protein ACTHM1_10705 [Solirubrobacteraceae bacterium]
MNLFIAGHSSGALDALPARRALAELLDELPFFDAAAIETWSAPSGHVAIAAVAHRAQDVGPVRYSSLQDRRAALFAGRPVRWQADGHADGQGALDPDGYLQPAERWAAELDGRCTVVRADDTTLELYVDPLGAYPVFESEVAGVRWFSNNAMALHLLTGDDAVDEEALASVLAGGWSLGGEPVWRAVRRVERGVVLSLSLEGERRRKLLELERIVSLPGAGMDAEEAAADLTALTAALAQWRGRPNVLPLTGGRDSRVIFAAALRAGFEFDARTGGAPSHPDVQVAARLAATAGLPHDLLAADPHGDRHSHLERMARMTALLSGGTATLADAAGFPLGRREGPLPLWHSGQGGEIARAYYGSGGVGVAERLCARFTARRPGRVDILSGDATHSVARRIGDFVQLMSQAGAAAQDIPDLFYLLERMACWAAPTHGVVEAVRDTTSPLWSQRMLPHLLGLPARERELERFHLLLLTRMASQLVDEPFADGSSWPSRQSALSRQLRRARKLSGKAAAELGRRRAGKRARGSQARSSDSMHASSAHPAAADPFDAVQAAVRDATLSQPSHPAWSALDRAQTERLLTRPAVSLDEMSRYHVWRLGSVFMSSIA